MYSSQAVAGFMVPSYLDTLNPEQRRAVETVEGPVLVLAGAGTGKTKVLTTRLVHILHSRLAYPSQILAVTFTNKAAQEMMERVASLLGHSAEGLWLGTFHALAVKILRRHGEMIGLHPQFTILDTDDQLRLLKQIIQARGLDDKKNAPRVIAAVISRWKDRGLTPDKVTSTEASKNDLSLQVYEEYQERLKTLNAVDFGDLLLHCLTLFSDHPEVLKHYQNQFKYILVDEYQDTNIAQYLWLRLLAQENRNICCVGDDDQSIYGWRGAEVGNILRFETDFPGAAIVRLEQNYRSTTHILGAASGLIHHNQGRLGKTLWTEFDGGEKVLVRGTWDSEEEARFIGDEVEALQRAGHSLLSMAILVRAGFQTREFEDRFLVLGIPYRVIGGFRFYERLEIRDALAYLRLLIQPEDGLAFERIVNTPKRGVGTSTLQSIHKYARENAISVATAARLLCETDQIRGAARTALRTLFINIDRWRDLLHCQPHAEVAEIVLDESGYTTMWREDKSADSPGRLENLKELISAMKEFESLPSFLEHVSLVMDTTQQTHEDMINLMTLHSAKGLEFKTVFLAGWEEGIFPHPRSLDESGQAGLEEERRLGYVGLTRARERAIITFCLNRRSYQGWQFTTPSRFIKELPEEHVTFVNATGSAARSKGQPSFGPSYRPKVIEAEYKEIASTKSNHSFRTGQRIFHQKFGYGKIIGIEGDQLHIHFDVSGMKKIMANFVESAE